MPEWLAEVAKETPGYVILAVIVVYGMRHMATTHSKHLEMVSQVSEECHKVQREARESLDKNTAAIVDAKGLQTETLVTMRENRELAKMMLELMKDNRTLVGEMTNAIKDALAPRKRRSS